MAWFGTDYQQSAAAYNTSLTADSVELLTQLYHPFLCTKNFFEEIITFIFFASCNLTQVLFKCRFGRRNIKSFLGHHRNPFLLISNGSLKYPLSKSQFIYLFGCKSRRIYFPFSWWCLGIRRFEQKLFLPLFMHVVMR